ncbi:MAG: hypothetical protein VX460_12785, partial [Planctomycetota bacterium]|nr:hypothetical protein [Planctomycetota bacterium]
MNRPTPRPAVSGGPGRLWTVGAATLVLLAIGCSGRGASRATSGALSPARRGAPASRATARIEARPALPARVAVELSSVAGAAEVSIVDASGASRRVTAAGGAVLLDADAPRAEVLVRGPLRIGETL